eukprot:ANDGO_05559.mRNA.1 hypothetical protein
MYSNARNTDEATLRSGKWSLNDEVQVVRWRSRKGKQLEVLCKRNRVTDFRKGLIDADEVLATDEIFLHPFTNSNKASLNDVRESMDDDSLSKQDALQKILRLGDFEQMGEARREEAEKQEYHPRNERIIGDR